MPRRALTRYIDRQYRTGSVVVAASGSVSHERLVRLVRKSFSFEEGEPERGPQATIPEEQTAISRTNGAEQVHLCLGLPGLRFSDSNKIPLLVLTTHLGSGMSSVLFQKVREQHGLAYTVYCYHDAYRDAGIFGAYFATDARAWPKAVDVTLGEFKRVTKRRLAPERLEQVKSQLKGQLVLGMESTPARMNRLARNELMLGRYVPVAETLADVDSVTGDDVLEAARRVFDQPAIVATALGPVKEAALRNAL